MGDLWRSSATRFESKLWVGVAAVHYPLRHVDPGPANLRARYIHDPAYRTAMHPHAQPEFRMRLSARLSSRAHSPALPDCYRIPAPSRRRREL